jgi:Bacterial DNA-binding protein
MNADQLVEAVEKTTSMNKADAKKAVDAVFDAIRGSHEATMIFRRVEGRSAAPDARRTIYLCG